MLPPTHSGVRPGKAAAPAVPCQRQALAEGRVRPVATRTQPRGEERRGTVRIARQRRRQVWRQAKSKALQRRISRLCNDFQVGKCAHLSETGCRNALHEKNRFAKAHIQFASATDVTHLCRLGRDCPFRGHVDLPARGDDEGDGAAPPQVGKLRVTETERRPQRSPTVERGYRQRNGAEKGVGARGIRECRPQQAVAEGQLAYVLFQCSRCYICCLVDLRTVVRAAGSEDEVATRDGCAGCSGLYPGRHRPYSQRQMSRIESVLAHVQSGMHACSGEQTGEIPQRASVFIWGNGASVGTPTYSD
jgi:hypothetical protein